MYMYIYIYVYLCIQHWRLWRPRRAVEGSTPPWRRTSLRYTTATPEVSLGHGSTVAPKKHSPEGSPKE